MSLNASLTPGATLRDRAADRVMWEARNPQDPEHGLVCIGDAQVPFEDRNKSLVGFQRRRTYADKRRPLVAVAFRIDDGPISWFGVEKSPKSKPRVDGFLKRWHGSRPVER